MLHKRVTLRKGDIEFDHHKRITHWSDKAIEVLGYSSSEIIGKSATMIVSDFDKESVSVVWNDLFNDKQINTVNRNKTKYGTEKYIKWVNIPITDENGAVQKISSFIQEVNKAMVG